jgi:hypothetical protein
MTRLRRYLVAVLLLLPLALICGKLLLTPVVQLIDDPDWAEKFQVPDVGTPLQHVRGWPWPFLKTVTPSVWPPQNQRTHVIYFSIWHLLGDFALFGTLLVIAAATLLRHRRRRQAWLRISLRELLLLTTVIAAVLGWWMHQYTHWSREQRTIARLTSEGANFDWPTYLGPSWANRLWPQSKLTIFHHVTSLNLSQYPNRGSIRQLQSDMTNLPHVRSLNLGFVRAAPIRPDEAILTNVRGFSALDNVESLHITGDATTDGLILGLGSMRSLKQFTLDGGQITDQALKSIARWKSLEQITITRNRYAKKSDGPNVTDTGIAHLSALPNLRLVWFGNLNITDAALEDLSQMPNLDTIGILSCSAVSDAGMPALVSLAHLKSLTIWNGKITDAALQSIVQIRTLEFLTLEGCNAITDKGILQVAELPHLRQLYPPSHVSEDTVTWLKHRINDVIVE